MNFFKSSKYKLTGSTKNKKQETHTKEQFHKLESTVPKKTHQSHKHAAPPAPTNDVTVCFKISNLTPYPWQLEGESAIFPEELGANDTKMIRIGQEKEDSVSANYVIQKGEEKFHVTLDVIRKNGKWFLKVDWRDFGPATGFKFKPVETGAEIELPAPEEEGFTVELAYRPEEAF